MSVTDVREVSLDDLAESRRQRVVQRNVEHTPSTCEVLVHLGGNYIKSAGCFQYSRADPGCQRLQRGVESFTFERHSY